MQAREATKPATGPAMATSKSALRVLGKLRRFVTEPNSPDCPNNASHHTSHHMEKEEERRKKM